MEINIMRIDLNKLKPDIRYLDDMRRVIMDKEWLKTAPNLELYYMYRGLKEENDLKYNITVVPARMLGKEFIKTKGHVHIGNYGEIYTVLEGEAIYLMQKMARPSAATPIKDLGTNDKVVEDVYAIKAKKGESVIIPPYYSHVTINPSNVDLKTGDWSSKNCKSNYSLFERLNGACYYYILRPETSTEQFDPELTAEGLSQMSSGQANWVKNKNYKNVPQIRFEEPVVGELDIKSILETTK